MGWLSMIPAAVRLGVAGMAAGLLIVGGAGVVWWGLSPRIELAEQRAATAHEQLEASRQLAAEQSAALARAQQHAAELQQIRERMQQLAQTINRNAAEQSRALEELKRNDQAVAEYLAAAVPAELGRLYARPRTTDPASYRAPALLPPDTVRATGAPGAGDQ